MGENNSITKSDYSQHDKRISNLESRMTRTETRTDHLEQKLDKIESNTSWILRIIISAIVMALLGLIMNGGM